MWLVLCEVPLSVMTTEIVLGFAIALCVHSLLWHLSLRTPLALQREVFLKALLVEFPA